MSDRFEEMRARGINTNDATATASDILQGKTAYAGGHKITGVLTPGGGSDDYNIFMQTTEPVSKNGLWIKENGSATPNVYFAQYLTGTGEFVGTDVYSSLAQTNIFAAQIVINDRLYSIAPCGNYTTYKHYIYDLVTRTRIGEMGAFPADFSAGGYATPYVWAFEHEGNILIVYNRSTIKYFTYYVETDTCSEVTNTGISFNTTDLSWFLVQKDGDDLYIYLDAYYVELAGRKWNLTSKTAQSIPSMTGLYDAYAGVYTGRFYSTSQVGKTLYILENFVGNTSNRSDYNKITRKVLVKTEMGVSGSSVTIQDVPDGGVIHVIGNYLYLFKHGTNNTEYYVYDIENDIWETRTCLIPYSISVLNASNIQNSMQVKVLDTKRGQLIIKFTNPIIDIFQLTESPVSRDLDAGTVVICEDFSGHIAEIQDSSNLVVGVSNTFIVKMEDDEKVLDGDHLAFYGDGVKWNLLKNPTLETCLVMFNSDGGSSVPSQQVIIGQTATKPTDPTKGGYVFDYWLDGNEEFNFSTKLIKDKNLTAKWLESITVTFNDGQGNITTQEVVEGQTATKPATDPTSSTGIFKYWTLNGTEFNFNTPIIAPITLIAAYDTFTEVEYIKSTGTQYIDTGIARDIANSYRMVGNMSFGDIQTRQLNGASGYTYFGVLSGYYQIAQSGTLYTSIQAEANKKIAFDLTFNCPSQTVSATVDGNSYSASNIAYINDPANANMCIFSINAGNRLCLDSKLWNFQLYRNGTLVRNFQPIKTASGVYCLFDKVENKPYYNAGTGSFEGPEILPSGYTKLNYLESTGTQYIDTGVYPYQTQTEITFQMLSSQSSNGYVAGAWNSNNRYYPVLCQPTVSKFVTLDKDGVATTIGTFDTSTHTVVYNDENNYVYFDEVNKATISNLTAQATNSIFICAMNGPSSTAQEFTSCKIYSAKITDKSSGTLIRNFVPAQRDSDSAIGLYDTVNDVFYTNAGTGTFISGGVA